MSTTSLMLIGIDLVAALVLAIGLFYRRHHRRDLVVAFLGVNVGVMAVAAVLGTAEVALGLGLFGVLSIIRLRSSEISQHEVAYYFAALAIGLISGLPQTDPWPVIGLIALILAVMWVADHPRMFARTRQQVVRLDRAISDESEIREELSDRLDADIRSLIVQGVDYVNDTTTVDVRYVICTTGMTRGGARVEVGTTTGVAR